MAMEFKSGFCKRCNAQTKVERKGVNHVLHLLLSVITGGLWLLIWIGTAIRFGGWRCATCGSPKVAHVR